jgi:thioesterase domain-containing protein
LEPLVAAVPHPTRRNDLDALCRALERRWHDEIPITAAMGISVTGFDGAHLEVRAALAPNVNVHGTAFAGSLFSLASLCGWGMVHLQIQMQMQMQRRGLTGSIVFVEGRIRCLAPVHDDVTARCTWSDDAGAALATLANAGRARIMLATRLDCGGDLAAEFSGEYAARLSRQ